MFFAYVPSGLVCIYYIFCHTVLDFSKDNLQCGETYSQFTEKFVLSFLDYVLDMFRRFNQCLGMERGELKLPRERNSFPEVFLKNFFKVNMSSCITDNISFLSWVEILVLLKVLDRINMTVFGSNTFTVLQLIYSS